MMGAVVTGRPVESAWLLHSERKGTIGDTPMVNKHTRGKKKRSVSPDGNNKVRKYEKKSRQVQNKYRLLK